MSKSGKPDQDDDWETDPDYVNDQSEQEKRWGGKRDAGNMSFLKLVIRGLADKNS